MRKYLLVIVAILLLSLATPTPTGADEFVDQPDNEHSNITGHSTPPLTDAESIVDVNFAKELHDALGDNGFHSMVITFAQCYGGGMMDDIADKFAGSKKPISMTSGAKHNEEAGAKPPSNMPLKVGDKNDGCSRWGQAYKEVHPGKTGDVNNNPKESVAYDKAKKTDVWTESDPKRTAQHKTLNNGGDIVLGDGEGGSGATSYHAILFAGSTKSSFFAEVEGILERDDYWNDIARQHKMLRDSGYPAANIVTLYGNGSVPKNAVEPAGGIVPKAATRQNLINAIKALKGKMNENEQLYIYIGDHGSPDKGTDTLPKPKEVPPKGTKDSSNTFEFSPLPAYMIEALQSPHSTSGPYIELNVSTCYTITSNWEVFFNDNAWAVYGGNNTFPGGDREIALRFPIDPEAINLTGDNDVWLRNLQPTDGPIEVEIYFSMGDIEPYEILMPVGDIAITNVAPSKTVVRQGSSVNIDVTVANEGDYPETFDVTLYIDDWNETQTVYLPNGTSTILAFTWNTTGVADGNYTISAYAWPIPGETDTADNTLVNGQVLVTLPDGVVGGCFITTAAYGTPMSEEIEVLRDFRDEYLLTNPVGEALVELYYKVSPPIAEFIDDHPALKPVVRAGLVPAVAMSTIAVKTTLAQKIAIVSSLALVSALLIVWFRKRTGKFRGNVN